MKKIVYFIMFCLWGTSVNATEIDGATLNLSAEQNARVVELKANLAAEIEPIWDEIESGRARILEIEKKYFEEFWNLLNEEQRQEFAKQNQGQE